MERGLQKNGLINLMLFVASGVATLAVARYTNTASGEVLCALFGLGILIAGVSWFQMRLEDQVELERLEYEELTRKTGEGRLFETGGVDALPGRRNLAVFEKYVLRMFTVALCLAQLGGAWILWTRLRTGPSEPLHQPLVGMALCGMMALVLYLMGKYSAGLAAWEGNRLLRPGSSYLLLGAYVEALVVAGLAAEQADLAHVDVWLARGLAGVLGLIGVETLLRLLFEAYRPRVRGQVAMPLYESRLVGLLSRPEGLFTTAAHALDYQFGFKVSETWFYQFLQRTLAWILLAQVGILLISTSFVFVEPGEEGLLERWGAPVAGREVLAPGFHVKWPWPVDRVHRFRTQEIQSLNVGFEHDETKEEAAGSRTLLWTVSHYKEEFQLLVASRETLSDTNNLAGRKNPPVNLLSLGVPVQYQVSDVRAWAYHHREATKLLHHLMTREVVRYLVGVDMGEIMSTGRFPAAEELRRRIQEQADAMRLGVRILFVGLQDIHPPVRVARSYEQVVAARQNRQADILEARAHQASTNALALAEALRLRREAEAEKRRLEVSSQARAALFTNQLPAYAASPSVYRHRAYLETLGRGAAEARKIILATTNTQDVILLNLEERIRADILDVKLPSLGNR